MTSVPTAEESRLVFTLSVPREKIKEETIA